MAHLNRHSHMLSVVSHKRQRGYLMVVSLLIILLITVMSISMAKSFFQEEGMAGNLREKSRSFAAAQAGLRYAEKFASTNGRVAGSTCAASGILAAGTICNNQVQPSTTNGGAPLQAYWPMPTPSSTVATFSNNATGDAFYATPGVYIQWWGPLNGGAVYVVTAFGYGGTQNSVSMVQSILQVNPNSGNGTGGAGGS